MNLDEFNTLIEAIYAAGADSHKWGEVLRLLTISSAGAAAALHIGTADGAKFSFGVTYNLSPETITEYERYYFSVNPLNAALPRLPEGAVVPDHALVPRNEMRSSEFHNDFGRRFQLEGSATLVLQNNKHGTSCLKVVRCLNSNEFEADEISRLKLLMPHLLRAVELHKQLISTRDDRDAGLAALDKLEVALFLLKDGGLLAHCNAAGEALLMSQDGLTVCAQKLGATDLGAARPLARMIHEATTGTDAHGGSIALPRQHDRRPLLARVLPIVAKEDFFQVSQVRAALFVSCPDKHSHSGIEHFALMHALTQSESRLAATLAQGASLQEAAVSMGIAKGTARKHLAHIMAKTATNRQAELIALILASRLPLR